MSFTFKKILLLTISWAHVLVRGKARRIPHEPKRVLVVQMAKLGDMVCTTPVFRALKARYPNVSLTVIGNKVNEALLEGNRDIDQYRVFAGFIPFVRSVRREKFDAVIVTGPDMVSIAGAFLASAPCILAPRIIGGRSPLADRWYRMLLPLVVEKPHAMGSYVPREYLRLLEPLDIHTDDTKKHLAFSDVARKRVETFLAEKALNSTGALVGILPASGNKVKEWPLERFATVAGALLEDSAHVVLVGSAADSVQGERIRELSGRAGDILNTCGMFSLDESKALISKLDLLVGVDTGPIYVAEAFGTATVDIAGPVDIREQPPVGDRHIALGVPATVEPQLHIMDAHPKDEREARRQVEAISVEEVMRACRMLLAR